jgi:carboxypeptidase family protein
MIRRVASFVVLGLLLVPPAAFAQLASQTALVGTVSDPAGLVLPGASVVAVNVGTRDTYEATTNAEGDYYIQFVKPGTYEVSVTVNGFQTFKATGVEVASNQVVRTNAVMQVGGINESVSVEARKPSASARSSSCR